MHQIWICGATDLGINRKFSLALAAFVVLGVSAWKTLPNAPIQIGDFSISLRAATLCILALFAVRSGLYFLRTRLERSEPDERSVVAKEVTKPM